MLDSISGMKYFTSLDLTSGYYQIRITEEDIPKMAFWTPDGLYQFKVLTFQVWFDECACDLPVCDERHAKALCGAVCRCVLG
jgi:hypothetical protein